MIERAMNIKGWMPNVELSWLADRAKDYKVIVEFGCYCGRSTRALADNTPGIVYAVDPWDGVYFDKDDNPTDLLKPYAYPSFLDNLSDHIDTGKVSIYKCKSDEFPEIKADFIFIDGDHRYASVKKDIEKAIRMVNKNGLIAGHDYGHESWPGVKQAVDELLPDAEVIKSIWYRKC